MTDNPPSDEEYWDLPLPEFSRTLTEFFQGSVDKPRRTLSTSPNLCHQKNGVVSEEGTASSRASMERILNSLDELDKRTPSPTPCFSKKMRKNQNQILKMDDPRLRDPALRADPRILKRMSTSSFGSSVPPKIANKSSKVHAEKSSRKDFLSIKERYATLRKSMQDLFSGVKPEQEKSNTSSHYTSKSHSSPQNKGHCTSAQKRHRRHSETPAINEGTAEIKRRSLSSPTAIRSEEKHPGISSHCSHVKGGECETLECVTDEQGAEVSTPSFSSRKNGEGSLQDLMNGSIGQQPNAADKSGTSSNVQKTDLQLNKSRISGKHVSKEQSQEKQMDLVYKKLAHVLTDVSKVRKKLSSSSKMQDTIQEHHEKKQSSSKPLEPSKGVPGPLPSQAILVSGYNNLEGPSSRTSQLCHSNSIAAITVQGCSDKRNETVSKQYSAAAAKGPVSSFLNPPSSQKLKDNEQLETTSIKSASTKLAKPLLPIKEFHGKDRKKASLNKKCLNEGSSSSHNIEKTNEFDGDTNQRIGTSHDNLKKSKLLLEGKLAEDTSPSLMVNSDYSHSEYPLSEDMIAAAVEAFDKNISLPHLVGESYTSPSHKRHSSGMDQVIHSKRMEANDDDTSVSTDTTVSNDVHRNPKNAVHVIDVSSDEDSHDLLIVEELNSSSQKLIVKNELASNATNCSSSLNSGTPYENNLKEQDEVFPLAEKISSETELAVSPAVDLLSKESVQSISAFKHPPVDDSSELSVKKIAVAKKHSMAHGQLFSDLKKRKLLSSNVKHSVSEAKFDDGEVELESGNKRKALSVHKKIKSSRKKLFISDSGKHGKQGAKPDDSRIVLASLNSSIKDHVDTCEKSSLLLTSLEEGENSGKEDHYSQEGIVETVQKSLPPLHDTTGCENFPIILRTESLNCLGNGDKLFPRGEFDLVVVDELIEDSSETEDQVISKENTEKGKDGSKSDIKLKLKNIAIDEPEVNSNEFNSNSYLCDKVASTKLDKPRVEYVDLTVNETSNFNNALGFTVSGVMSLDFKEAHSRGTKPMECTVSHIATNPDHENAEKIVSTESVLSGTVSKTNQSKSEECMALSVIAEYDSETANYKARVETEAPKARNFRNGSITDNCKVDCTDHKIVCLASETQTAISFTAMRDCSIQVGVEEETIPTEDVATETWLSCAEASTSTPTEFTRERWSQTDISGSIKQSSGTECENISSSVQTETVCSIPFENRAVQTENKSMCGYNSKNNFSGVPFVEDIEIVSVSRIKKQLKNVLAMLKSSPFKDGKSISKKSISAMKNLEYRMEILYSLLCEKSSAVDKFTGLGKIAGKTIVSQDFSRIDDMVTGACIHSMEWDNKSQSGEASLVSQQKNQSTGSSISYNPISDHNYNKVLPEHLRGVEKSNLTDSCESQVHESTKPVPPLLSDDGQCLSPTEAKDPALSEPAKVPLGGAVSMETEELNESSLSCVPQDNECHSLEMPSKTVSDVDMETSDTVSAAEHQSQVDCMPADKRDVWDKKVESFVSSSSSAVSDKLKGEEHDSALHEVINGMLSELDNGSPACACNAEGTESSEDATPVSESLRHSKEMKVELASEALLAAAVLSAEKENSAIGELDQGSAQICDDNSDIFTLSELSTVVQKLPSTYLDALLTQLAQKDTEEEETDGSGQLEYQGTAESLLQMLDRSGLNETVDAESVTMNTATDAYKVQENMNICSSELEETQKSESLTVAVKPVVPKESCTENETQLGSSASVSIPVTSGGSRETDDSNSLEQLSLAAQEEDKSPSLECTDENAVNLSLSEGGKHISDSVPVSANAGSENEPTFSVNPSIFNSSEKTHDVHQPEGSVFGNPVSATASTSGEAAADDPLNLAVKIKQEVIDDPESQCILGDQDERYSANSGDEDTGFETPPLSPFSGRRNRFRNRIPIVKENSVLMHVSQAETPEDDDFLDSTAASSLHALPLDCEFNAKTNACSSNSEYLLTDLMSSPLDEDGEDGSEAGANKSTELPNPPLPPSAVDEECDVKPELPIVSQDPPKSKTPIPVSHSKPDAITRDVSLPNIPVSTPCNGLSSHDANSQATKESSLTNSLSSINSHAMYQVQPYSGNRYSAHDSSNLVQNRAGSIPLRKESPLDNLSSSFYTNHLPQRAVETSRAQSILPDPVAYPGQQSTYPLPSYTESMMDRPSLSEPNKRGRRTRRAASSRKQSPRKTAKSTQDTSSSLVTRFEYYGSSSVIQRAQSVLPASDISSHHPFAVSSLDQGLTHSYTSTAHLMNLSQGVPAFNRPLSSGSIPMPSPPSQSLVQWPASNSSFSPPQFPSSALQTSLMRPTPAASVPVPSEQQFLVPPTYPSSPYQSSLPLSSSRSYQVPPSIQHQSLFPTTYPSFLSSAAATPSRSPQSSPSFSMSASVIEHYRRKSPMKATSTTCLVCNVPTNRSCRACGKVFLCSNTCGMIAWNQGHSRNCSGNN